MVDSTKEEIRQALATISTLKRVMGIPNLPGKKDRFDAHEHCHIYTPDKESAILLGELLYRYGNGPRESFYNARPDVWTIRDGIRVERIPEGGYDASMWIPHAAPFTKALEKMIKKQIAPDSKFTR